MNLLETEMTAASCLRAWARTFFLYLIHFSKLLKHSSSIEERVAITGRNKLHTMAADYCSLAKIYPLCLDHIFHKEKHLFQVIVKKLLEMLQIQVSNLQHLLLSLVWLIGITLGIFRFFLISLTIRPIIYCHFKKCLIIVFYLFKQSQNIILPRLELKAFSLKKREKKFSTEKAVFCFQFFFYWKTFYGCFELIQ